MKPTTSPKQPASILSLALDGSRLDAAWMRRSNGSVEILKSFSAQLNLDPLRNETELVGREIRKHLDAAGVRERRCIFGLPLNWTVCLLTQLPDLEENDLVQLLCIEAERGFPRTPDELQIVCCRFTAADETPFAAQMAVPLDYLNRIEQILASAQLRPVSFSLAAAALPEALAAGSQGCVIARIGEAGVEFLISIGGGVASLRTIDGAFDTEGGAKRLQSALLARELRITLGQLPESIRPHVKQLRIAGSPQWAQALAREIQPAAAGLGLAVEAVTGFDGAVHGLKLPAGTSLSPAVGLAALCLSGRPLYDFLPPRPTFWQQLAEKYSSKRLVWAGASAAAVVLITAACFLIQQIQLSSLRSQWAALKPKVDELDELQSRIKQFRPFYDANLTSLSILRRLSESFPEEGSVSAKSIEIRGLAAVSVSGVARDNQVLLKTIDQLRSAEEVVNVKVEQIRGKSPMQYTFNFAWNPAPTP